MSAVKDKLVIIFSGYNERAVVSFIRTLEKNNVGYVVIARDADDSIFKTAYKDNVFLTRERKSLDIDVVSNLLQRAKDKYEARQCFIAPSTEALNRFMESERPALENIGVTVPLADAKVYTAISDKKIFNGICRDNGIDAPMEYGMISDAKYPFVAKPKQYRAQDGSVHAPFLIFDGAQRQLFLKECRSDDFYFQEYVEGRSIYLLYYFHRDGNVFKYSQENLVQQAGGRSMLAAISSDFHKTSESLRYEKLFSDLGFFGLVMVEVRVDGDKSYMIEANPRFWGPSQLFVDSGMNLFEAFLHDYGFIPDAPAFHKSGATKYFWFGGVLSELRNGRKPFFHQRCENELLLNLGTWIQHDIYNRPDTVNVFRDEIEWTQ